MNRVTNAAGPSLIPGVPNVFSNLNIRSKYILNDFYNREKHDLSLLRGKVRWFIIGGEKRFSINRCCHLASMDGDRKRPIFDWKLRLE